MNFKIGFKLDVDDSLVESSAIVENPDAHREGLGQVGYWEGGLVVEAGDETHEPDFSDPIIRLAYGWMRKLPWLIGGDTETLALRNSAQCFAFVPTGSAVEMSFFDGDESEIEEYVIQPMTIPMEVFVESSLAFARELLDIIKAVEPASLSEHEDCKDLSVSFEEAQKAWHEHQLRNRR